MRGGKAVGERLAAYLVTGDDEALVREATRELVAELTGAGPAGLAAEEFPAGEDVSGLLDALSTPPFLADRRVVVVRDVGQLTVEGATRVAEVLADPLPTTTAVFVAGGGRTSARLVDAVKRVGRVVDAGVPTGRARTAWLADRLGSAPVALDAAAGARLGQHLGDDLGRLGALLDVLAATYGEGAKVGVAELEPFLGEAGAVAPWDLTDAVDRGDVEAALGALHRLLGAGQRHPLQVMATLSRHFGAMLRLDGSGARDAAAAARLTAMSPFPAKKALDQARRLGPAGVARAVGLLADADLDLRGASSWPEELVLEVLVARLCRLAPAPARR